MISNHQIKIFLQKKENQEEYPIGIDSVIDNKHIDRLDIENIQMEGMIE